MDLASLSAVTDGESMTLRHPITRAPILTDGEPVTITVISRDHPEFRRHLRKKRDRDLAATVRETPTAEKFDTDFYDNIAATIRGWSGIVLDGAPLTFSPENARRLVADERFPFIAEQIDIFASDRANFIKASYQS